VKIAYVLYPDFTALDLVGPYEVISRWPDAEVHFLSRSLEPVRCDCGLTVIPTDTPTSLPDPDLIVVPGSGNPVPVLDDQLLIEWLRAAAPGCQWTASVCTGAGLYAAAGLLEGKKTTTHWGFRDTSARWASKWSPTASSGRATTSAARAYRPASTWPWPSPSASTAASWRNRFS
jgi:putative intracellular protease/amidase